MRKYYYILIFTGNGPVYVTQDNGKYCYWYKDEAPYTYSTKKTAEETASALRLNGNHAVVVTINHELRMQPYQYEHGEFIWKEKEEK